MDRQKSGVYRAEQVLRKVYDRDVPMIEFYGSNIVLPPERKFGTIESVQTYVDKVLGLNWVQAQFPNALQRVLVRPRRGQGYAHYSMGEIAVPTTQRATQVQWAMRELVILHEIAHHFTLHSEAHGKEFARAYVDLVDGIIGHEAGFVLRGLFYSEGVL